METYEKNVKKRVKFRNKYSVISIVIFFVAAFLLISFMKNGAEGELNIGKIFLILFGGIVGIVFIFSKVLQPFYEKLSQKEEEKLIAMGYKLIKKGFVKEGFLPEEIKNTPFFRSDELPENVFIEHYEFSAYNYNWFRVAQGTSGGKERKDVKNFLLFPMYPGNYFAIPKSPLDVFSKYFDISSNYSLSLSREHDKYKVYGDMPNVNLNDLFEYFRSGTIVQGTQNGIMVMIPNIGSPIYKSIQKVFLQIRSFIMKEDVY